MLLKPSAPNTALHPLDAVVAVIGSPHASETQANGYIESLN
jgi:hypothetical protein